MQVSIINNIKINNIQIVNVNIALIIKHLQCYLHHACDVTHRSHNSAE